MSADDAKAAVTSFLRAFENWATCVPWRDYSPRTSWVTSPPPTRGYARSTVADTCRACGRWTSDQRTFASRCRMVEVEPGCVLVMVEVHAQRGRSVLHNFSGQLATVTGANLSELWMVEALPAESDAFWS